MNMGLESEPLASTSSSAAAGDRNRFSSFLMGFLVWVILLPVLLAVILYHLNPFDPAAFPHHEFAPRHDIVTPALQPPPQWVNDRILQEADLLVQGNCRVQRT
ncbi:hypothetical protein Droror1_Dr00019973 [Drosera rotundifolia]